MTFVSDYKSGAADIESIHDYVNQWIEQTSNDLPIHRFLGLTFDQYNRWKANPNSLYGILQEITA